jgi:hypothetical protein
MVSSLLRYVADKEIREGEIQKLAANKARRISHQQIAMFAQMKARQAASSSHFPIDPYGKLS